MTWPDGPVLVTVPATSANLGPGFDSIGLALACRDQVQARVLASGVSIEVDGEGQQLAGSGEEHLVIRAMRAGFAALGSQPPGIGLRCRNSIPQGYGLGSSAAAIIAGLLAARALAGHAAVAALPDDSPLPAGQVPLSGTVLRYGAVLPDAEILRLATGLEGHPDNAAACLAGGLTIAWTSAAGPQSARLEPAAGLRPVICLPSAPVATAVARQALPATVRHADAAANSARAALLIAALTTAPALLMDATEDFLHQSYRAGAMPATARLVAALRAAGIPAVISGAGPAVLALTDTGTGDGPSTGAGPADVAALAAGLRSGPGGAAAGGWRVRLLEVDRQGATVATGPL